MGHVLRRNERREFIFTLLVIFGVGGAIMGYLMWQFKPELLIKWYPAMPLIYLLLGLALVWALDKILYRDPRKLLTFFLVLRSFKTLITILVTLLYFFIVNENTTLFFLTLMIFYFAYLIVETWIFYRYEQRRQHRHKAEKVK